MEKDIKEKVENTEIVEKDKEVVVEEVPHYEAQLQALKDELQTYKDKERQNTINSITNEIDEIQSPIVKRLLNGAKDPKALYNELLQENIIKKRVKKVVVENKEPKIINTKNEKIVNDRQTFLKKIKEKYGDKK